MSGLDELAFVKARQAEKKAEEANQALDEMNTKVESVNQTANDLRSEVATAIQYVDDTVEGLRQEVSENLDSLVTQEVENKMTPFMEVVNEHFADDVSKGEVHGLRVFNGKLEYFDGQEWQRAKLDEQRIYGVRIDKNNSNPETRVTYIGDAVGFTPMRGNDGNFDWGSWQNVFESFEIRPVVLQNRQVQYYLDPNDFTKKIDGSPANLTGTDGDVMIEFGKPLWWKWTDEGDTYTIEISNKEFDGAVKHAFEIEEGYNLVPYYPLLLTQILFVIFFKSTDSQTALGRGYVDDNSTFAATGGTNAKGMFYGESTGNQQMKFLGIEDYWGNKSWWIDGLVTDDNFNLLIGKGNFNNDGSGYQTFASGVSSETGGYIDSVQGGNDKGFIMKSGSGSGTTYYADYVVLNSPRVARFGGSRTDGSRTGFADIQIRNPKSGFIEYIGARLFCSVGDKIYIGAYLGTSQNEQLRSVSGTSEPTGNKNIGTFRTEARANN